MIERTTGPTSTRRTKRKAKRQATKARIKAMPRGRRIARRSMIVATWLLGVVAAVLVTAIVAFYALTDVPRPETLPLPQVVTVQYSDGSTLARIGSVDRTIVHLQQVPTSVRWAVLAAEDRGFYTEPGVSVRGTARAAWSDVTGGDTQGGSGITQQYVKNAYLDNAQTLSRKLKELMIAVKLTRQYTKDQILEFYLNSVYFGRGAYGIQAAAQAFFGKNVDQLDVAQGAVLAGLLRSPAYYDPSTNPTAARARWQYVLNGMVTTGHLGAEPELGLAYPKVIPPSSTGLGTTGWKYLLTNQVLAELAAHGVSAAEINAKGLVIRTTIDRKAQAAAVSAITTTFKDLTPKQRNLKNSLVAVNPASGAVLAYYGGSGPGVKGYDGKIDFNDWAAQRANPAGSAFKPYVLATVLSQTIKKQGGAAGIAINSLVDGSYCKQIDGTKICNDPGDKSVSGAKVSVRKAMKYSLNTTFDELAFDAGPAEVARTAHAMGVAATDSDGRKTLVDANGQTSFGIGIGDYAVTALDQASGFATLADKGVRNPAYLVQQATASDGSTVYLHGAAPVRAIDARVANDVTLTLEPVAAYSDDALTGGRASAAKTGTVGIDNNGANNSDAWMVGFTPQVSAAVWVGTGARTPIYNSAGKPLYGANLPGRTWRLFMDTYLQNAPDAALPSTQQIAADGSTQAAPSTSTSPPNDAPSDTPSTDAPSTDNPSTDTASTNAPSTGDASTAPSTGTPSTETPAIKTPTLPTTPSRATPSSATPSRATRSSATPATHSTASAPARLATSGARSGG